MRMPSGRCTHYMLEGTLMCYPGSFWGFEAWGYCRQKRRASRAPLRLYLSCFKGCRLVSQRQKCSESDWPISSLWSSVSLPAVYTYQFVWKLFSVCSHSLDYEFDQLPSSLLFKAQKSKHDTHQQFDIEFCQSALLQAGDNIHLYSDECNALHSLEYADYSFVVAINIMR